MRRLPLAALGPVGAAAVAAAAVTASVQGAAAQVVSESILTTTLSQSFAADSNYNLDVNSPGTSYYGDTRLGLGLVRATDTRSLRFFLDTGLRAIDQPDEDFQFILASPSVARVAFNQAFANNAFDIDASARSQRIDRQTIDESAFFDDQGAPIPVLPQDVPLITNNTYEQRYDLNTGFVTGTQSPSTFTFRLRASDITYNGDSPEDFTPRTAAEPTVLWRLRLNPLIAAVATAGYRYENADNSQDSEINTTEFDLGVNYTPREAVSVTVGAGYADRKERTTTDGIRSTETNTGITLRALATYATEDLNFAFNTRYTTAAPSSRFSGNFQMAYDLPRGALTARLFQNYGLGSDGTDRRVTGGGVGYTHAFNSVSGMLLNVDASSSASANDPATDTTTSGDRTQVDFTAQYNRALTRKVSAALGYQLTQRYETDPGDATSHRVFVRLGRSFETGL